MVREFAATSMLLSAAGCSWILDFSDRAIPRDAAPDAPYSAEECAYKEPNDSIATAAAIAPADSGPAAICAGGAADLDFYRFAVPVGATRVEIRVDYAYRATGDLDLRLYDRDGVTPLALSSGFGSQERIVCPDAGGTPSCPTLAAGEYVFEVFPAPGSVNRYTFSLTIAM